MVFVRDCLGICGDALVDACCVYFCNPGIISGIVLEMKLNNYNEVFCLKCGGYSCRCGGQRMTESSVNVHPCTLDGQIITKHDLSPQHKSEIKSTTLPVDSQSRKEFPLYRGVLRYFPAALAGVARVSKAGNDKHNPGQDLHHDRSKSMDHGDCIIRHLVDVSDLLASLERNESINKQDILNEANQLAWRALAFSQELHERFGAPLAPGAKK